MHGQSSWFIDTDVVLVSATDYLIMHHPQRRQCHYSHIYSSSKVNTFFTLKHGSPLIIPRFCLLETVKVPSLSIAVDSI